jgi:hypothetical protein
VTRDLLAAREVLRERGHAKGILIDRYTGAVCARGAEMVAVAGGLTFDNPRVIAQDVLMSALVPAYGRTDDDRDHVGWNNAPERTAEDVEQAFDDAASLSLDGMDCKELP